MKRVLVTGGTGFIGRWVVDGLVNRGCDVRVFDAVPNPAVLDDARPGLSSKVQIVQGDIADGSVRQAAQGCDGIVHLAGVLTMAAAEAPIRSAEINVMGAAHVFEAAREQGMARLVYVSSSAVFAYDDPVHPKPLSLYGAHKLAIEGMARAYHLDHGITSVGFRPYVVYGPGRSSGIAAGPSIAISSALEGKRARIAFTGRVGFVHVFDVARYMVAALLGETSGAEAYNLCGESADMEAFRSALLDHVPDAKVEITGVPLRSPPDLANSPLPQELAGLPVTDIADGIAATLAHYRSRASA